MMSLRLHLKVVSLNHYKFNSVSIEAVRTPGGVSGVSKFLCAFFCHVFCKICHDILLFKKIFRAVALNSYANSALKGLN